MGRYDAERKALGMSGASSVLTNTSANPNSRYAAERETLRKPVITPETKQPTKSLQPDYKPMDILKQDPVMSIAKSLKPIAPLTPIDQRIKLLKDPSVANDSRNYIGSNLIPAYKEDSPLAKIGKGIVNYGVGGVSSLFNNIMGAPGQTMMQTVTNTKKAVENKPLDFNQKSMKNDIYPKQYGQFVDKLAQKGPVGAVASGFIQGAGEGIPDPGTWVGGGIVSDLSKAGIMGKGAKVGTAENLAANAVRNQKAILSINKLKSALREPIQSTSEAIRIEPIKAVTKEGTFKVRNTALEQATDEYNSAIKTIQNHFKTNELRSSEIPLIKSDLGIDLDSIIAKMEDAERIKLPSPNDMRLKRIAGVASNKSYELSSKLNGMPKISPIRDADPNSIKLINELNALKAQEQDVISQAFKNSTNSGVPFKPNIVSAVNKKPTSVGIRLGRAYNTIVDNTSDIGKAAGIQGNIATTAARNAGGTVEHSLKNGLVNMEGKQIVDTGMQEIYNLPKDQQSALDELLYHQHNIDRLKQGKPIFDTTVTSADSRQAISDILSRYPHLQERSQEVRKTLDSLLNEWGVKSGLVSKDLADVLHGMYENYVPTYRKMAGADAVSYKTRGMGAAKIINQAIGGDEPLITLKESIPMLMNKTIKAAKKNEVYKTILDAARKDPQNKYARVLQPVGKIEEVVNQKLTDQMFETIKNDGLEGLASVTDKALEADPKLGYVLTVMESGKPVKLQISEDLFNSLKSLDKVDDTALNKTLLTIKKYGTNPFKSLVTGYNPLFAVRNVAKDIPTAFIQGTENNPFRFVKNLFDAGKDMATKSDRYQEYKALGGQGGNYFNVEKGIAPDGKFGKLLKGIGAINNATETLPRYAEYIGTLKRGGEGYANKMKGLYNAQEVTTNFGRHGDLTKSVDAVVPYLNPAVQGFDKAVRTFKNPANIAKAVGIVTAPTAALYAINQMVDKQGYDQLDNRTKDNYFLIPEGNGKFTKIPKSREAGVLFGALFERLARASQGKEAPFKGFVGNAAMNLLPNNPITSNYGYPVSQVISKNGKDYAGRDIVPKALQGYSPQYQYDAQTSEIAKAMGSAFGLSPKKIDYLIRSYTGIIGQAGLPLATKANYSNGKGNIGRILTAPFTADALYNNEISNDFYNNLSKAQTAKNDAKLTGMPANDNLSSGLTRASDDMSTIRSLMKQVEADQKISNSQKQSMLRDYQQKMLDVAATGNKAAKNGDASINTKYPELTGQYYPENSFTFAKHKYTLTPGEYETYRQAAGDLIKKEYAAISLDKNFSNYPDATKDKIIQSIIQKANGYAQYQILKQKGVIK